LYENFISENIRNIFIYLIITYNAMLY